MKGILYSVAPKGGITGAGFCALEHAAFLKDRFEGGACLVVIEDTPLEERAKAFGVSVLKIPFVNAGLRQAGGWKKLSALPGVIASRLAFSRLLARKLRATGGVLHIHSLAQHTVYALHAGRTAGVPVALTVHEPPQDLEARDRKNDLFFVRRWKPPVVLLTEYARRTISPMLGACPVHVVPNAAVLPPAAEVAKASALRETDDIPLLLFAGALCEGKGADIFLRACGILHRRGIRFRAKMAGLEMEAGYAALAASENLEGTVVLTGVVREGLDAFYRETALLAAPSRRDSYPRVVMEAMGWGIPVVASGTDGIPFMVQDGKTGLLVPPGDPEALAGAMERLLLSPRLRFDYGMAGRSRAEGLFSPAKYAERMLSHYRDMGAA